MKLSKEEFLETYNICIKEFEKASLEWGLLLEIYNDYKVYGQLLFPTAETIANILRNHDDVHSVRTRVKDPKHLLGKIIRKTIKVKKNDPESDYVITIDNYKTEVTDLIGVRVLHLYKEQAVSIDGFIRDFWDLQETATVYYREGDYSRSEIEKQDSNQDFNFEVHPAGYRSWHYLISTQVTREPHISEIQVRTIFEEGYGEIDHQLRYPNDIKNVLLTEQLLVLNRIAGSADEMANTIRKTKNSINSLIMQNAESDKLVDGLNEQLDVLLKENKIKDADKEALEEKVKELQQSRYTSEGLLGRLNLSDIDSYIKPRPLYEVQSDGRLVVPTTRNLEDDGLTVSLTKDFSNGIFSGRKYLEDYRQSGILKKDE